MLTEPLPLFPVECPHNQALDYCSYIKPAALRALVLEQTHTPEEILCKGIICSAILFWSIQEQELRQVVGSPAHLSPEEHARLLHGMQRCLAVDRLLKKEATIALHMLPLEEELPVPCLLPSLAVQALTHQVLVKESSFFSVNDVEAISPLMKTIDQHHSAFLAASVHLSAVLAPGPHTPFSAQWRCFPQDRLHELTWASLAVCHAQPTTDEYAFVAIHQIMEVWFTVVLTHLQEAIAQIQQADVLAAAQLVDRLAEIFLHLNELIAFPKTISPQNYLGFRPRLAQVGSGAESIQFRAIEILLGLRDKRYHARLASLHVLTPELDQLFAAPSLNEAFLDLLSSQGYFPEPANFTRLIHALVSEEAPQLIAFLNALEHLEKAVGLWRLSHLLMVQRMIGDRPMMHIGGSQQQGNGLAYLQQTLTYPPLFPFLQVVRRLLPAFFSG